MSHIPIAFLLLGAPAPRYALAVIWDRKEENSRMRRLKLALHDVSRSAYRDRAEVAVDGVAGFKAPRSEVAGTATLP